MARSGYIPRLNFNAGLGSSYYTVSGQQGESFSARMKDNFSKQLGFSLSVPIFDAFSTRNNVRQAKVRKLSARSASPSRKANSTRASASPIIRQWEPKRSSRPEK